MKCVQNVQTKEIKRVPDSEASKLVNNGNWKYIGKQEWKKQVRDS